MSQVGFDVSPGAAADPAAAEHPIAGRSKWKRFGIPAGIALLALGIGSGMGSGSAQSKIDGLKNETTAMAEQVAAAENAGKTAQRAAENAADALSRAQTSMTKAEGRAKTLDAENATLKQRIEELEKSLAEAQATAAPPVQEAAPAPQAFTAPAPASVYYKNCTAARAAGAAPLYAGSPGYGSHLDRDGDGVACE